MFCKGLCMVLDLYCLNYFKGRILTKHLGVHFYIGFPGLAEKLWAILSSCWFLFIQYGFLQHEISVRFCLLFLFLMVFFFGCDFVGFSLLFIFVINIIFLLFSSLHRTWKFLLQWCKLTETSLPGIFFPSCN